MNSRIEALANERGLENIQQFAIAAGLSWPVAKKIWQGNIGNIWLKTLVKAAVALDCQIEDLYELNGK